jgi:hypothetical protein
MHHLCRRERHGSAHTPSSPAPAELETSGRPRGPPVGCRRALGLDGPCEGGVRGLSQDNCRLGPPVVRTVEDLRIWNILLELPEFGASAHDGNGQRWDVYLRVMSM